MQLLPRREYDLVYSNPNMCGRDPGAWIQVTQMMTVTMEAVIDINWMSTPEGTLPRETAAKHAHGFYSFLVVRISCHHITTMEFQPAHGSVESPAQARPF